MRSMLLKVWFRSQETTIAQSSLPFTNPVATLLLFLISSPSWLPENSCILVHMPNVRSISRPLAILVQPALTLLIT